MKIRAKTDENTPPPRRFEVQGQIDKIGRRHHVIKAEDGEEAKHRFAQAYSKVRVTDLIADEIKA